MNSTQQSSLRSSFDEALGGAVAVLQLLPRTRDGVATARGQVADFRASFPDVRVELVVDQPPGSFQVDYDLLLEHPGSGTVAIGWRPDDGVPWAVNYADHWAANYVVTVNDRHTTVQDALLWFRLIGRRHPDLINEIVDEALLMEAIEQDPPPVSSEELQRAADAFRGANALFTREATDAWLKNMCLSRERFEHLLRAGIQTRKLKDRIAKDHIESYFEEHKTDFDTAHVFRVDSMTEDLAYRLRESAQIHGLLAAAQMHLVAVGCEVTASLGTRYVSEFPTELAAASRGSIVGPVRAGERFWVAEVLDRQPSTLDERTRAVIMDLLVRGWFADQRDRAKVRWHWM